MKVMLFYPPGELYQRGEDRCQINVQASTANSMRACNDLGYMASALRRCGDEILLKDYATEKLSYADYISDVRWFKPDVLVLSVTNTTIFSDIEIMNRTMRETGFAGMCILKGALFFDAPAKLLNVLDLSNIDILIGGEAEWVICDIIHSKKSFSEINCIFYKTENGWEKTDFSKYNMTLDKIPYPARDLMNNELYTRPDTGEPMATIQTSHGCPSNCIYCLSPQISGRRVRFRSPENVMGELEECYHKYHIKNFFFRADTFTINKDWVLKLCSLICDSDLHGKIAFTANSRVKPLSLEVLKAMKEAGCFAVAFGLESGSEDTMKKIKKGATVKDNLYAVRMAKEVGLLVYGFFMIGFPWETMDHLQSTKKAIFKMNCDFIEISLALPYYGTELYGMINDEKKYETSTLGTDIYHISAGGTDYVSAKDIITFRRRTLLEYYMRPIYLFRKLRECRKKPKIFLNYMKYGFRMLGNLLLKEDIN